MLSQRVHKQKIISGNLLKNIYHTAKNIFRSTLNTIDNIQKRIP